MVNKIINNKLYNVYKYMFQKSRLEKRGLLPIYFLISQLKHVVGTQKNHLTETVPLDTPTNVKTDV